MKTSEGQDISPLTTIIIDLTQDDDVVEQRERKVLAPVLPQGLKVVQKNVFRSPTTGTLILTANPSPSSSSTRQRKSRSDLLKAPSSNDEPEDRVFESADEFPEGTPVYKEFDEGFFYGRVSHETGPPEFSESSQEIEYFIKYEDGDEEWVTVSELRVIAKAAATESKRDDLSKEVISVVTSSRSTDEFPEGTPVLKEFDAGFFAGTVSHDEGPPGYSESSGEIEYFIKYEDGDQEWVTVSELRLIASAAQKQKTAQEPWRRKRLVDAAFDPSLRIQEQAKRRHSDGGVKHARNGAASAPNASPKVIYKDDLPGYSSDTESEEEAFTSKRNISLLRGKSTKECEYFIRAKIYFHMWFLTVFIVYSDDEFSHTPSSDNDESDSDDDEDSCIPCTIYNEVAELNDTAWFSNEDPWYLNVPDSPHPLSDSSIEGILEKIPDHSDKALQKLLFDAGFQFTLLQHQFLAVRKVAGVPPSFPYHKGSAVAYPTLPTYEQCINGLDDPAHKSELKTRGVLLADEMGLGKTVEAIAGVILRNSLASAKKQKLRASVIVSPNDAVMLQWRDTLILNGVSKENIFKFQKDQSELDDDCLFLLMTRYSLQAEVKRVFDRIYDSGVINESSGTSSSVLFPAASPTHLRALYCQYIASACKHDELSGISRKPVHNSFRKNHESLPDAVSRHLRNILAASSSAGFVFETVIIDEAHFLKNRTTYWGIGAGLLGCHSSRAVPLTGTPYNNGPTDLASMMTFINPRLVSSKTDWWLRTTANCDVSTILRSLRDILQTYFVRRKKIDVLGSLLVAKIISENSVSVYSDELLVYNRYEEKACKALQDFGKLAVQGNDPVSRAQARELFQVVMALLSNMRSAVLHPVLPNGREITKLFSPSRRGLLAIEERKHVCVCCNVGMRPSVSLPSDEMNGRHGIPVDQGVEIVDDDATVLDPESEENRDTLVKEEKDEDLVRLPRSICKSISNCGHYAHVRCLEKLQIQPVVSCPRCVHIENTLNFSSPTSQRYCKHINGGFTGSSKIEAVLKALQGVPEGDKVLVLSFFKGGLDLLEGILVEDKGIPCARFDGDVDRTLQISELERFRRNPSCRVLLASVQSGGVGLNIVEANHVFFLDRFFNPFVHDQAEDRCHRIGQKKNVFVSYFDASATVDQAMVHINNVKKANAVTLLADGIDVGSGGQNLTYEDLSGTLSSVVSGIRAYRNAFLAQSGNGNLPIPPFDFEQIKAIVAGRYSQLKAGTSGNDQAFDLEKHSEEALQELIDTDDEYIDE